jgi:hypothetical protein
MAMDDQSQAQSSAGKRFCPECGTAENGFFCRNCGTLLYGEDRILCPRCHQVVPDGEYCNQCGQSLGGLALHLRQLAIAGDTFWVTSDTPVPVASGPEETVFQPDESVTLAAPELPDWLQELAPEGMPESESHIYPALQPIVQERQGALRNSSFLVVVIIFMLVLMLGLMFLTIMILLRGGA